MFNISIFSTEAVAAMGKYCKNYWNEIFCAFIFESNAFVTQIASYDAETWLKFYFHFLFENALRVSKFVMNVFSVQDNLNIEEVRFSYIGNSFVASGKK